MATTQVSLPANTVTEVTSNDVFIYENPASTNIYVSFADAPPTFNKDTWHTLYSGKSIARNGVTGNLYAYSFEGSNSVLTEG